MKHVTKIIPVCLLTLALVIFVTFLTPNSQATEENTNTTSPSTASTEPGTESTETNVTVVHSGTCGENLTWTLDSESTLTISGTGAMTDFSYADTPPTFISHPWASAATTVKSIVIEQGVTSIGKCAFSSFINLQSVTIPDSVTTVGLKAFYECSTLQSIAIPNSVTSLGDRAFENCSSLQSVYITDISAWCNISFYNAKSNPLYYGASLYLNNEIVTDLIIPESVTVIPFAAFYNCKKLQSVTIPDSVINIGQSAFCYCSDMIEVTIGDRVERIDFYAFDGCASLQTVFMGKSVTYIDEYAFRNCTGLVDLYVTDLIAWWDCGGVFAEANPLYYSEHLHILDENRNPVTEIVLDDTLTEIPQRGFYKCSDLTSITIPNSVTSIGVDAFTNCSSLKCITIPDSVTTIPSGIFSGCSSLESITIPFVGDCLKTAAYSYQYPFGYIFGTKSYDGGTATKQTYYGNNNFSTTSSTYYVPVNLKSVTVTSGNILYGAFYNCSMLNTVTIPESVSSIESYAFYGCSGLQSMTIPESVSSIGSYAFYNCSGLKSITLGNSLSSLGSYAFFRCSGLIDVYASLNTWWRICRNFSDANPMYYGDNLHILDENGKPMTEIVLDDSLTEIPQKGFYRCSDLTSITISNSITSIGDSAFYLCSNLQSITIPDSVTTIGSYTFEGCANLNYNTHKNARYLGNIDNPYYLLVSAISTDITECAIHESTVLIYHSAFSHCENLGDITIPESVTTIGNDAFSNCTGIQNLYYGSTQNQWNNISIGSNNSCLTNANIHYNHVHDYTLLPPVTVAPTCSQIGYIEYTCIYGETYRETLPALGHIEGEDKIIVSPTCTKTGYTQSTCIYCGNTICTDYVDPLGHDFNGEQTVVVGCNEQGYTETMCVRCDATEKSNYTEAQGHKVVIIQLKDATCTEQGVNKVGTYCDRCSAVLIQPTYTPALGHDYVDGICTLCQEKDPNYTEPEQMVGDFTGDSEINNKDVIVLLWNILFPEEFPLSGNIDLNQDGKISNADINALLWYALFPEEFPLTTKE